MPKRELPLIGKNKQKKPKKQENLRIYVSPLLEAKRYKRLLNEPHINSYTDIANELGVTRARITQMLNLLKLAPEIQKYLLNLTDQQKIRYFTERRLRMIVVIKDRKEQIKNFKDILNVFINDNSC